MLGTTRVLGVYGHPVEHSLSPVMQNAALRAMDLDYIYVPFHVLPERLEQAVNAVRALDMPGVNVTIPHKERVIGLLDEVSNEARDVGSVNTIINDGGRLRGESTDGPGFLRSIEAEWGKLDGGRAVILGAGGSAKAVAYALAGAGWSLAVANRTRARAEELAASVKSRFGTKTARAAGIEREELRREIADASLLVNTTPVGMYPDCDSLPVPADLLHAGLLVYDLIYNPLETRLISEARAKGIRAMNGMKMLVYQGALSLEMWTGRKAPVEIMERAIIDHFAGCGSPHSAGGHTGGERNGCD